MNITFQRFYNFSLLCAFSGSYSYLNYWRGVEARREKISSESKSSERIRSCFERSKKDIQWTKEVDLIIVPEITKGTFGGSPAAYVCGNTFFDQKRSVIASLKKCQNRSNEDLQFLFKHEFGHLENNHLTKIPIYCLVAGLLPLTIRRFPFSAGLSLSSIATTSVFYTRYTESEAEQYAIKHATDKEIEVAMGFRKKYGRDDLMHPPIKKIIDKMKKELVQRAGK